MHEEAAQLAMLLDGIDLNARRLTRWAPKARYGKRSERSKLTRVKTGEPPTPGQITAPRRAGGGKG